MEIPTSDNAGTKTEVLAQLLFNVTREGDYLFCTMDTGDEEKITLLAQLADLAAEYLRKYAGYLSDDETAALHKLGKGAIELAQVRRRQMERANEARS